MNVKFYTQWRRPKERSLKHTGDETITETAGYMPAKMQIERFFKAGRDLTEWRKENYDYMPEDQENDYAFDVTRTKGFDIVDAWEELERLTNKKDRAKMLEIKTNREAAQAEQDELQRKALAYDELQLKQVSKE